MQSFRFVVTEAAERAKFRLQPFTLVSPGPGEVVIEMEASSVNPIDVKRAQGYGKRVLSTKGAGKFPLALGNDIFGTVAAVGTKVQRLKVGDRVFGLKAPSNSGAHATHVIAKEKFLRPAPAGFSAAELAALPYSFTTMMLALKGAGLDERSACGRSVLVLGAGGGLGQFALQVLAAWGAQITAVCETTNEELCKALGATETVDRFKQKVRDLPARFDAVLNFAVWDDDEFLATRLRPGALGHATTVHPLLANFDRLGWIGGGLQTIKDKRRVAAAVRHAAPGARYAWTVFGPDETALNVLAEGLAKGHFRLPIGLALPLADGAQAFDHVREGRAGRAILMCKNNATA
ncbi:MAG: alcohol dehydrogenase catalytic domain-containing protein [Rhodocyclaceae bacterium]|nr:alcohol dehydrogenase catalytic domain-containing protein [Rhodocyclaceae bacterium]MBP6109609.1 alcohol dehydrogenase catalytic domain-containing protein [Rhodocyclaceae bacterium]MBP6278919.1 alcohol dehydrogenase catalytic domain-containing protein [Rhodocyclaceae bacterium]